MLSPRVIPWGFLFDLQKIVVFFWICGTINKSMSCPADRHI